MTARKRPSAADYLAELDRPHAPAAPEAARPAAPPAPKAKRARPKLTFDLPAELVAELRAASLALPPRELGGSLSALAERALRRELEALAKRHHGGRPFAAPGEEPRARRGRPPRV